MFILGYHLTIGKRDARLIWLALALASCRTGQPHSSSQQIANSEVAPTTSVADPADAAPRSAQPGVDPTPSRPAPRVRPARLCPQQPGEVHGAIPRGCPRALIRADRIVSLKRIDFEPARFEILPASLEALRDVAAVLHDHPEIERVRVEAHVAAPAPSSSRTLSRRRAQAVRKELINLGVESRRLEAVGFGAERPLDSNQTPAGRNKNRRIEFRIVSRGSVRRVPLP